MIEKCYFYSSVKYGPEYQASKIKYEPTIKSYVQAKILSDDKMYIKQIYNNKKTRLYKNEITNEVILFVYNVDELLQQDETKNDKYMSAMFCDNGRDNSCLKLALLLLNKPLLFAEFIYNSIITQPNASAGCFFTIDCSQIEKLYKSTGNEYVKAEKKDYSIYTRLYNFFANKTDIEFAANQLLGEPKFNRYSNRTVLTINYKILKTDKPSLLERIFVRKTMNVLLKDLIDKC